MEKPLYKTEVFEGPLDLLLFLITKHKLNINDIPIFELVEQYTAYVRALQQTDLNLASEFLEMAARLVYIKTVSLLPQPNEAEELKKELSGELIEYRDCKAAAAQLAKHTAGFDLTTRSPAQMPIDRTYARLHEPMEILRAYLMAAGRNFRRMPPPVEAFRRIVAEKVIAVGEKISELTVRLRPGKPLKFRTWLRDAQSRSDLVARFLAVLELCKSRSVYIHGSGTDFSIELDVALEGEQHA